MDFTMLTFVLFFFKFFRFMFSFFLRIYEIAIHLMFNKILTLIKNCTFYSGRRSFKVIINVRILNFIHFFRCFTFVILYIVHSYRFVIYMPYGIIIWKFRVLLIFFIRNIKRGNWTNFLGFNLWIILFLSFRRIK